jgi:hypothetical protein
MQRLASALLSAGLLAGCAGSVDEVRLDTLRAGMSKDEVETALGPPQSAAYSPGQDCAHYTVMKSFWRRVPWSMTERYVVCYAEGRVDTFGRVDERTAARGPS